MNSPRLSIESVNRQAYVTAVIDQEDEAAGLEIVLEAALAVERAGAEFIIISCNDVHRFVPDIIPKISIPFLHIAEATAMAIKEANIKTVALMGVRKTMEGDFYPKVLAQHGIETLIPNDEERTVIHDAIYDELVKEIFHDATRQIFVDLIHGFQSRGAEGVVLGCTEIPLLIRQDDVKLKTFSTTDIHCAAAIEMALG